MKTLPSLALIALTALAPGVWGEETVPYGPDAPSESDFAALKKTSPFTRVLSLPETYALRGVATIGGAKVATLYNRETKKTLVVTPEGNNDAGISLVEVVPAAQLDGVTAKIAFAGDEAELRYETSQLYPEPKGGSNGPPGSTGSHKGPEGEHRGPSQQDIDRYKSLSPENQAKFREYIGHVMKNYPNLSREERGNMMRGAMMRLIDGRELEIPQAPPGGGNAPGGSPSSTNDSRGGDRGSDRGSSDRGSDSSRSERREERRESKR